MNIEELRTSLLNTNKNGYTRITAEQKAEAYKELGVEEA